MSEAADWEQIQKDAPKIDVCMVVAKGESCSSDKCQAIPRREDQEERLFADRVPSKSLEVTKEEPSLLGSTMLRGYN